MYECIDIIRTLLEPCPDRKVPLLVRLLKSLDHDRDPELYVYVYISIYVADSNDDDIFQWDGGPDMSCGSNIPDDHRLIQYRNDLRVLARYNWEMSGVE